MAKVRSMISISFELGGAGVDELPAQAHVGYVVKDSVDTSLQKSARVFVDLNGADSLTTFIAAVVDAVNTAEGIS